MAGEEAGEDLNSGPCACMASALFPQASCDVLG